MRVNGVFVAARAASPYPPGVYANRRPEIVMLKKKAKRLGAETAKTRGDRTPFMVPGLESSIRSGKDACAVAAASALDDGRAFGNRDPRHGMMTTGARRGGVKVDRHWLFFSARRLAWRFFCDVFQKRRYIVRASGCYSEVFLRASEFFRQPKNFSATGFSDCRVPGFSEPGASSMRFRG